MARNHLIELLLLLALTFTAACQVQQAAKPLKPPQTQTETRALPANSSPQLKLVIDGATAQIGKTTSYDASYQKLEYPNGDVPIETGVCSDVIVRAFRQSGIDLQKDVHEDMKGNFSAYPARWGLKGPGDIITWDLGTGQDHVGMVVNVWYKPSQRYLIVHNIGAGTRMEDVLFAWRITGHYRYF